MTRLKQAWLALCGKLEPEVREVVREVEKPVVGDAHRVKLFRASSAGWPYRYQPLPKWHGNVYLSCEQAHSECPGAEVKALDAIEIGGVYLRTSDTLTVQPKPKIAKGKRRNG